MGGEDERDMEDFVYGVREGTQKQQVLIRNIVASEATCVVHAILVIEHRPCIIIHRRENHAVAQQLVPGFLHIRNVHAHRRCYILHMQSFVVLWTVLQRLVYPLRRLADIRYWSPIRPRVSATTIADSTCVPTLCFDLIQWTFDKVEMHVCCLQKVVCDLHFVSYRSYDMGSHMAFVVESLQSAPDTRPFILDELWL